MVDIQKKESIRSEGMKEKKRTIKVMEVVRATRKTTQPATLVNMSGRRRKRSVKKTEVQLMRQLARPAPNSASSACVLFRPDDSKMLVE